MVSVGLVITAVTLRLDATALRMALLVSMEIVVEQCLGNDRPVVGDLVGGFLANLLDTSHVIVERFVALWVGEAECFLPRFGGDAVIFLYAEVGDECGYRCRGVLGLVDFLAGVLESLERYFVLVEYRKASRGTLAREICRQTHRSYAGRELGRSGRCGCNKSLRIWLRWRSWRAVPFLVAWCDAVIGWACCGPAGQLSVLWTCVRRVFPVFYGVLVWRP